jgi:Glycosyl transferase family 11
MQNLITCQLQSGLGNQLFQIAATVATGYRNQSPVAFDFDCHIPLTQGRPPHSYRSNLLSRVEVKTIERGLPRFIERSDRFELPPNQPALLLQGSFQCREYFVDAEDIIKDLFKLDSNLISQLRIECNLNSQPNCNVHVRRGDYLRNPPAGLYPLPDGYFQAAIAKLPQDTLLVVCSDDIAYCHTLFAGLNCVFFEEDDDVKNFHLIAACDRQIISNSTFSWWASYLSASSIPAIAPRQWLLHQGSKPIPVQHTPHLQLL